MNSKKLTTIVVAVSMLGYTSSLVGKTLTERLNEHMEEIRKSVPGIGLISEELDYYGLKIRNFQFDTAQKYTIVRPGEKVSAEMDYEINAENLQGFDVHHFLYGLYPYGPIDCLVHSLGLKDSKGHTSISFTAPKEKGIYQLRICYSDKGLTYKEAHKEWSEHSNPPNNTIVGIVVVE